MGFQKTGADSCRALNGRLHGDVFDDSAASCFGKLDFLVRHDLDLAIVRAPMPTSPSQTTSHSCQQAGPVTAELTSPTVVAAWLRAAVEAPVGAAWLVSWV